MTVFGNWSCKGDRALYREMVNGNSGSVPERHGEYRIG